MKNKLLSIIISCFYIFILFCFLFLVSCGHSDGIKTPNTVIDLEIVGVHVMPQVEAHPLFVSEEFSLNVTVRNSGTESSGMYYLKLHITEVSSGFIHPIGTFLKDPIPPGEVHTVYSRTDLTVNNPGLYMMYVEIIPIKWEDANLDSNITNEEFNVVLY